MIYILSWITKKHLQSTFQATTFKVEENSGTFQGLPLKFEDFSTPREPWDSRAGLYFTHKQ